MNATDKKRLCWNCEARVPFSEENCSYCGVYLSPMILPGLTPEDEIPAPLYKPVEDTTIPKSPYGEIFEEQKEEHKESAVTLQKVPELIYEPIKTVAIPMGLLLGGSVFFLFGMILFLFASDSFFTLQWNGAYWFIYVLLSLPMLFCGWKKMQNLDA
ncbi:MULTISPECIES: hypothetical protein [Parachlamydia]|jgi:hypothetical protein|uniref:Uncharacterized protein n=2 Tax=Parachlamydia acanthamoebae TaxID=83552 RepID=F8KXP0_PARAV|nr:hypothetical protein [Parachlamydia acanthamoebae]EFB42833.1 hypothetical protein pah_c001o017 [Parachlamydia acanthamoebae str. Hall's coccus]KIA76744.1 hypothetical protein DB43_HK00170 [Parachlamydia acanthamoebae]CCB87552.1 putative uncharacterized protein [Parachlamydia acanthamoebae UV-7]